MVQGETSILSAGALISCLDKGQICKTQIWIQAWVWILSLHKISLGLVPELWIGQVFLCSQAVS